MWYLNQLAGEFLLSRVDFVSERKLAGCGRVALSIFLMLCFSVGRNGATEPTVTDPALVDMGRRTEELQQLRFGMFICWSFSTFSGMEWTRDIESVDFFQASGCDTDQWCRTAKESGMGYILFLTKHHDGFCLWDTQTTDRKVTESPLGIDVLAQLRESCDKYGIKLALYFSEGEWRWPGPRQQNGGGLKPEMKKSQLKELLTQYGPIQYIWFDHAIGTGGLPHDETTAWCKQLQPECFIGFNHGDQASADIRLGERGRPGPLDDQTAAGPHMRDAPGSKYRLAEFTYPIQPSRPKGAKWFYSHPDNDDVCLSAEKIYADYLGAEKYGNIYSLDIGPMPDGQLRPIDVATLLKVGQYVRGEIKPPPLPISQGQSSSASSVWQLNQNYGPRAAFDGDPSTRWGAEEDSRSGWLAVDLGQPITIDHAVIDEGDWDRVRRFELQFLQHDQWKTVSGGTTLGPNKELKFEPVQSQHFRLNILEAKDVPTIHEFTLW
ncbi:alpha-L-fucosidase [Novipirellula herctigrandis]